MTKFTSVYIHYPFCRRKCNYCDFASIPLDEAPQLAAQYPELLRQELALWGDEADLSALRTVYLGGGTPSLMEPSQAAAIMALLPGAAEITLEANPETIDQSRLAAFRVAGIDRLSLGAQSFQPPLLQAMGRGHSAEQTAQAVTAARVAGFSNIGLDLIYGLPGQSLQQWRDDIEQALALTPQHLSLYCLALTPLSPWGRLAETGQLWPAGDDQAADMAELAAQLLIAAGYHHYEIANFALPGFESQHNSAYWQRANYLGLGAAAASCAAEHRWTNQRQPDAYAAAILDGRLPIIEEEWLDMDQVLGEAMFLGLRLLDGIDIAAFTAQYGVDPRRRFRKELARMNKAGLLIEAQGRLLLTPRGTLLGDRVFAEFV